jgi:superfamily II helicase
MHKTKFCKKCKKRKKIKDFYSSKSHKDGLDWWCKDCSKEAAKRSVQQNPERRRLTNKKYYVKNKERISAYQKQYHAIHRKELAEYAKVYAAKNQRKIRAGVLKRLYGISIEEYERLLVKQKYCCAICKVKVTKLNKSLCVDHDHKTGKIRGLLCENCNNGLGGFRDNIKFLQVAQQYLRRQE